MRAIDIIQKKRSRHALEKKEIDFLLLGYLDGAIPDYQMSAFLMAVVFNGMDSNELLHFTQTMSKSGDTISFPSHNTFIIDKHSTGGVGDKTSITLAPLLSVLGIDVAKLSGRGLGFTGGTIDKFESIKGFTFNTSAKEMQDMLIQTGIGLMGYSDKIVPLDKKLYTLRDVTATVESIPLIASSIMSKKLALTTDGILLDVKVGNGAFMKDIEHARDLAHTMYDIGKKAQRNIACVLSNMNQPLGSAVGNALELIEAIETLKGNGPKDFTDLVLHLSGASLLLKGDVTNIEDGKEKAYEIISSKSDIALKKLFRFIELSGGDPHVVYDYSLLPRATYEQEICAEEDGYISAFQTDNIGIAAMMLGAGRETKDEKIDHSVGLKVLKKLGDTVRKGESLVKLYYNDDKNLSLVSKTIQQAITIQKKSLNIPNLILDFIY